MLCVSLTLEDLHAVIIYKGGSCTICTGQASILLYQGRTRLHALLCIDNDYYLPLVHQFLNIAPGTTHQCTSVLIKPISPADRPTRTFTVSISPFWNDPLIFLEPTSVLIRLTNEGVLQWNSSIVATIAMGSEIVLYYLIPVVDLCNYMF